MGKTSSGKSTFLNTLLGTNDLLPTGANQTTSGITYIRYGESPRLEITFGDGKTKTFTSNLQQELQRAVSVGGFTNLPFTLIDDCILGGMPAKQLLSSKEELEGKSGMRIDAATLKRYVDTRKVKDIPTQVVIYAPLPEHYRNWQILDTPGIGAIGGIENKTFDLLNAKTGEKTFAVDAIIFCVKGTDAAEDKANIGFIRDTIEKLNPVTRKRLFLVATHANSMKEEEAWIKTIQQQLGSDLGSNRPPYLVDSFVEQLRQDLMQARVDIEMELLGQRKKLAHWSDELYKEYRSLLRDIQDLLEGDKKKPNNENYLALLEQCARFSTVKTELDKFVSVVRGEGYEAYMSTLKEDLEAKRELKKKNSDGDISAIDSELQILQGKATNNEAYLAKLQEQEAREKKVRLHFSEELESVREEYSRKRVESFFEPIVQKVDTAKASKSNLSPEWEQWAKQNGIALEEQAQTNLNNLLSELEECRIAVMDDLQKRLSKALEGFQVKQQVALPSTDFGDLRAQCIKKYTTTETRTARSFWGTIFTLGLGGKTTRSYQVTDYKAAEQELRKQAKQKLGEAVGIITNVTEQLIKDWTAAIDKEIKASAVREEEIKTERKKWLDEMKKQANGEERLKQARAEAVRKRDAALQAIKDFLEDVNQLKK